MAEVTVLLATYNGAAYIRQQVDSILGQSFSDFRLILSDDGSTDNTPELLEQYAREYPDKIVHYRSGQRFGCAQDHFMHLLQQFRSTPYIMFCDQDDVWHPDKIAKTLQKMKQISKADLPAMVHTDLRVVDGALNQMDASFIHFSKLRGDRLALRQLLVQNVVTGCTMMVNQTLADLACNHMPKERILMHDWWLAMIASAMGCAGYLDEATIDYRQHGNNVVGAKNTRSVKYIAHKLSENKIRRAMEQTYAQARVFDDCFGKMLDEQTRSLVQAYAALAEKNGIARRISCVKYGFWKYSMQRKVAQLIWS